MTSLIRCRLATNRWSLLHLQLQSKLFSMTQLVRRKLVTAKQQIIQLVQWNSLFKQVIFRDHVVSSLSITDRHRCVLSGLFVFYSLLQCKESPFSCKVTLRFHMTNEFRRNRCINVIKFIFVGENLILASTATWQDNLTCFNQLSRTDALYTLSTCN